MKPKPSRPPNITRFGNPILRQHARRLTKAEIKDDVTHELITRLKCINQHKKYGVGLAAPQIGIDAAISIIDIKPTPTRPDLERFETVIINPSYIGVGRRRGMWEGCQSSGAGKNTLYAKALRYRTINAIWTDENGRLHEEELTGFVAHVFQHETDHLDGVLFVDKVRDRTSFMLADEYKKRIVESRRSSR